MYTIHLDKLHFFAHHGLHDEEALAGNGFIVDVAINFDLHGSIQSLSDTINYVEVYECIKHRMDKPVKLLEMLAELIVADIQALDNRINSISININKINPPISQFTGMVGVTLFKEFNLKK